ncbi:hypothetical protein O4220_19660 [Rhodococcus ruber]|uniref:Uncharacterized protein n=1 Tax=Rhodococcus ruber TaxID=1830 RepID=A0ABT4MIB3_9NOCA|nr:hypothetical protein [Rhodococcus ruber]MCZ4520732.1 hypothetical protein [Rhodococcus ruber]
MHKNTSRTILGIVATVPLSFALATPASAAPEAATLSATSSGDLISLQFALTSDVYTGAFCRYEVYPEDPTSDAVADASTPVSFTGPNPPITVGPVQLGTYEVYWSCYNESGTEFTTIGGSPEGSPDRVVVDGSIDTPTNPTTGSAGSSNVGMVGLDRILAGIFG